MEAVLEVVFQQVAVAEGSPSRPVDGIDASDLHEVLNGLLVVSIRRTGLGHAVDRLNLHLGLGIQVTVACLVCRLDWSWLLWQLVHSGLLRVVHVEHLVLLLLL